MKITSRPVGFSFRINASGLMTRVILAIVAVLLILALAILFSIREMAQTAVVLDAEEQTFLTLINDYRRQNGLPALEASVALTTASKWMSTDMSQKGYFSHTDSLGRDPFTRMRSFGYNYNTWMGENIAAGYSDARNTFNQWKASSGHNQNMLNPNYRVIGIGRAYNGASAYRYYWTTDFGGTVDQVIIQQSPTPTPTVSATPTPTPTPTPSTTPALLNPGFETAFTSWTATGSLGLTTSKPYLTEGRYAAVLLANRNLGSSLLQWITLKPGATYELSADLLTDNQIRAVLGVRWDNYADGPFVAYAATATRQPTRLRFTVPAGTGRVAVYLKATATTSGSLWATADNFKLVQVGG